MFVQFHVHNKFKVRQIKFECLQNFTSLALFVCLFVWSRVDVFYLLFLAAAKYCGNSCGNFSNWSLASISGPNVKYLHYRCLPIFITTMFLSYFIQYLTNYREKNTLRSCINDVIEDSVDDISG